MQKGELVYPQIVVWAWTARDMGATGATGSTEEGSLDTL